MEYRLLNVEEIKIPLFSFFERRQEVTRCWRKREGQWQIEDIAFVDDWSAEDYAQLVSCLKNTLLAGGWVMGAFLEGRLKGFASLEAEKIGSHRQYMDLSSLHVSKEWRGKGVGRELFLQAKIHALRQGAEKLYISSHSAVESQAFYKALGCIEAQEYNRAHTEREPCDCQLECVL